MISRRKPSIHRLAIASLLAALALVVAPATGQAAQIDYDIEIIAGTGPSGAGSFVYDDALGQVLDFQITLLDDLGPFSPVGICDGCPFDYSVVDTAALFDLPSSDTFQQQEEIAFQGGFITLLLETDGSYGEFNGRASGRYRFVRAAAPIPEPSAAMLFAAGFGVVGAASRRTLARG